MIVLRKSFYIHWSVERSPRVHEVNPGRDPSGWPCIHLKLYNVVMREHKLDEAQMIMFFPLSLGGATQRWFASLDPSRRRTWVNLGQEFIREYSFNTIVEVSQRELEALR